MRFVKIPSRDPSSKGSQKSKIADRISAISAACDLLMSLGIRPSINLVVEGSGVPRTSLMRKTYHPTLKDKQAAFDLQQGRTAGKGEVSSKEDGTLFDPATHEGDDNERLIAWLRAEIERKDLQIARLVETTGSLKSKLKWNRTKVTDLEMLTAALGAHLEDLKRKKRGRAAKSDLALNDLPDPLLD